MQSFRGKFQQLRDLAKREQQEQQQQQGAAAAVPGINRPTTLESRVPSRVQSEAGDFQSVMSLGDQPVWDGNVQRYRVRGRFASVKHDVEIPSESVQRKDEFAKNKNDEPETKDVEGQTGAGLAQTIIYFRNHHV